MKNTVHFFKPTSRKKGDNMRYSIILLMLIALLSACTGIRSSNPKPEFEYTLSISENQNESEARMDKISDSVPYRKLISGDLLAVYFSRNPEAENHFVLRPRDIIEVRFSEASDLNVEQPIQPDGTILLPYIEKPVVAAGITAGQLNERIRTAYKSILKVPEVLVIVKEFGKAVDQFQIDISENSSGKSWETKISLDGHASFPVLGEIYSKEITLPQLRKKIQKMYADIVDDLRVDVVLKEAAESWIFVLGEVNSPGPHTITQPVGILKALALAQGQTREAKLDSAVVFRRHSDSIKAKRIDLKALIALKSDSEYINLKRNDILYIPRSSLAQLSEITRHIRDILFFRGWDVGIGVNIKEL